MLLLSTGTDVLKLITSTGAAFDVFLTYVDLVGSTVTVGPPVQNSASAAATYTLLSGTIGTARNIKSVNIYNRDAALSGEFTVYVETSLLNTTLRKVTLQPGEALSYDDNVGWSKYDINGRLETKEAPTVATPSIIHQIYKVGTACEAAGVGYCFAKDTGNPGAWAPGTPGLAGRATDGTAVADVGCIPLIPTGAGKTKSIKNFGGVANQVATLQLMDILWINSGLVVTTTGAQTVNSVAFPARDIENTVNGKGCMIGLLVTAATTNAGAVTNMQVNYTDNLGNAGVATLASFPATAVVGSVVWFQLAAGDVGVQSIQSVTLGTSLATGSVSLFVARGYSVAGNAAANFPMFSIDQGNVTIAENACLILFNTASAATAVTVNAAIAAQDI